MVHFFSFLSFSPRRRAAATAMRVQHLGMPAAMLCGACSLTPGGAAVLPRLLTRTAWDNLAFFSSTLFFLPKSWIIKSKSILVQIEMF